MTSPPARVAIRALSLSFCLFVFNPNPTQHTYLTTTTTSTQYAPLFSSHPYLPFPCLCLAFYACNAHRSVVVLSFIRSLFFLLDKRGWYAGGGAGTGAGGADGWLISLRGSLSSLLLFTLIFIHILSGTLTPADTFVLTHTLLRLSFPVSNLPRITKIYTSLCTLFLSPLPLLRVLVLHYSSPLVIPTTSRDTLDLPLEPKTIRGADNVSERIKAEW
ncbi:MAG: hypothetical protein JOS17DRAFT_256582 [Linnemannia elongata]|nr:MAG: hypothetical protein JOS17DRAFT_256582 [Linnemannia elongata]